MQRWEQRIEAARRRRILGLFRYPRFTTAERELASTWATCAVGEARRRYGVAMDATLGALGVRFYRAVLWNMVETAAEIHEAIELHALDRKREEWERRRETACPALLPAAELHPA
jgi:hypothetical protein